MTRGGPAADPEWMRRLRRSENRPKRAPAHHEMSAGDSCMQSRERQSTALHGAPADSAACRALQLAGALTCSDCAFAGALAAPAELSLKDVIKPTRSMQMNI